MQETRIAVVMNGGISLAVWMGGVTHELNRARLASGPVLPAKDAEQRVHQAWKAILARAGKTVVVDTIAGTSAGGLNGTLLATAVARGADLDGLRRTWVEEASLEADKLLRAKHQKAPTLLDGDFFTEQINGTLDAISDARFEAGEVNLMVTATAVGESLAPMILEGGGLDYYRDSRRVFRFRRELSLTEDLAGVNHFEAATRDPDAKRGTPNGPLARAARASASYPVAFAPVLEDEALKVRRVPGGPQVPASWLMDGGVLDNAPFGPVLDALRQRPISGPFERVLLYVVPSASGRALAAVHDSTVPDVGEVLSTLLTTIREPDQRLDIAQLGDAFQQMSFQRSTPHALLAEAMRSPQGSSANLGAAAAALLQPYRIGRAEAFYRWLMTLDVEPTDLRQPEPVPVEVNPDQIPVIVPAIASTDEPAVPMLGPGERWCWGSSTADRLLRWLGRALVQVAKNPPPGLKQELLDKAFVSLEKSQRTTRRFMINLGTQVATEVAGIKDYETRLAMFVEVNRTLEERTPLADAFRETTNSIAAWLGIDADAITSSALHLEVLSSVFAWGGDENDVPQFKYLVASPAARPLISVPAVTYDRSDARYDEQNRDWAAKKLYGERWGHFGAFATRHGRERDWAWGRLDGASALLDLLLGKEVVDSGKYKKEIDTLVAAILDAEKLDTKKVGVDAERVVRLSAGDLLDDVLKEPGGEDRRELLLRTIPEVLGTVAALPPGAEATGHVMAAAAETYLDLQEFNEMVRERRRNLFRRVWGHRPWA